jgi:hypothetical protein
VRGPLLASGSTAIAGYVLSAFAELASPCQPRAALPTIAEHLQFGQDVTLTCDQCNRQRELDLAGLVSRQSWRSGGAGDALAMPAVRLWAARCDGVRVSAIA